MLKKKHTYLVELQHDTRGIDIVRKNILNGKEVWTIFKNTFQLNDASEWMNQLLLRGLKNLSQQVLSSRLIFFCPKADLAKHHQTVISEDESWERATSLIKPFPLRGSLILIVVRPGCLLSTVFSFIRNGQIWSSLSLI